MRWFLCRELGGVALALGLLGCLADSPSAQAPAPSAWGQERTQAVEAAVERSLAGSGLPGAVVAAGDAEGVRVLKAFGQLQSMPVPVPMSPDALFDLASVTKVVGTTTAVMLLVDEGRIGLDDPVSRFLPQWRDRPAGEVICIRHLLTHTSGLPAYVSVGPIAAQYGPGPNPEAVITTIAGLRLRGAPGSGVEYSCLNAILAGRVVENVAGRSLHALLTERVFLPLGMMDTGWQVTRAQLARLAPTGKAGRLEAAGRLPSATGEGPFASGLVHDPLARYYTTAEHCAGNAGLFSTAADLGRFARMILGRGEFGGVRVLRAETVDPFTRVETPPGMATRGYGWDVWNQYPFRPSANSPPERQAVGHFGYTGTMIWIDKNTGLWAVVLTNRLHWDPPASVGGLRRDVLLALVGEAKGPAGPAAPKP